MPPTPQPSGIDPLQALYARPGFMLRRAHQIATSIFLQASAPLGATTTQYGVLTVLQGQPGIDQITLARRLGLDRSTAGSVVSTLERTGYISRVVGPDRRRRTLELTQAGNERLAALHGHAADAVSRLLAPLTPAEADTLRMLLGKLTRAHNGISRVPLDDAPASSADPGAR